MTAEEARKEAKKMLSRDRFYHTECVAAYAKKLALRYGANVEKARIAGFLHDIAKELPRADLLQMAGRSAMIIDVDGILEIPQVLHAYAGGVYVAERYEADAEIAEAVSLHTSGGCPMSLLSKIIYVADALSSDRSYEGLEDLRILADASLDLALLRLIEDQIVGLVAGSRAIDPNAIRAYNCLLKQEENRYVPAKP